MSQYLIGRTLAAVAITAVASSGIAIAADRADGAAPVACRDLFTSSHTIADEDACRDRGWTVRDRYVLSPDGRIWTNLPRCATEDAGRCVWNASTRGNGHGKSFVNVGSAASPRLLFVTRINGHRA